MRTILTCLLLFVSVIGNAQKKGNITQKDIQLALGDWKGNLLYTDYKDDSTQVTLKTSLTISAENDTLLLKSCYTEPGGNIIKDSAFLYINDSASQVIYNGDVYSIMRVRRTSSQLIIINTRDGKDNNKDAEIRQTFTFSAKSFSILKQIRYLDGAEDFFMRHQLTVLKNNIEKD